MFSLDNFYYVLYANLLQDARVYAWYFHPFGSISNDDLCWKFYPDVYTGKNIVHSCLFYDQEPIFPENVNNLKTIWEIDPLENFISTKWCKILANSELSAVKTELCRQRGLVDWYYFFHGFAALHWYRDYKYLSTVENQFTKVFISLNRLTTKDRSYRLLLVSEMLERGLVDKGIVSLHLADQGAGTWREELIDPASNLSKSARIRIYKQLSQLDGSLIVDKESTPGSASADAGALDLKLQQSALWHVVSETIFYYPKLHLTEKVFKPIVAKRPFMLVAAPGNLAYLKSYGFKTFDRWIDESYDNEQDNDLRIAKVMAELEKLCQLSEKELSDMHHDMKEVLDFNFNHFYNGDFKHIIVNEMIDNFKKVSDSWNSTDPVVPLDLSKIDLDQVKTVLLG